MPGLNEYDKYDEVRIAVDPTVYTNLRGVYEAMGGADSDVDFDTFVRYTQSNLALTDLYMQMSKRGMLDTTKTSLSQFKANHTIRDYPPDLALVAPGVRKRWTPQPPKQEQPQQPQGEVASLLDEKRVLAQEEIDPKYTWIDTPGTGLAKGRGVIVSDPTYPGAGRVSPPISASRGEVVGSASERMGGLPTSNPPLTPTPVAMTMVRVSGKYYNPEDPWDSQSRDIEQYHFTDEERRAFTDPNGNIELRAKLEEKGVRVMNLSDGQVVDPPPAWQKNITMGPPITLEEQAEYALDHIWEYAPFVGAGVQAYELYKVIRAGERIGEAMQTSGEISVEDAQLVQDWIQWSMRDKEWGSVIFDIMTQSGTYMAEYALTGGLYAAGKELTAATMKAALIKLLRKDLYDTVRKITTRKIIPRVSLAETAAGIGGEIVRSGSVGFVTRGLPKMIAEADGVAGLHAELDAKGQLLPETLRMTAADPAWKTLTEETMKYVVENLGERSGKILDGLGTVAKRKFIGESVLHSLAMANPDVAPSKIKQLVEKLGFHGVISEIGEERVTDAMSAALHAVGLNDDFQLPSIDSILQAEFPAFLLTGGLLRGGAHVYSKAGEYYTRRANESEYQALAERTKETVAGKTVTAAVDAGELDKSAGRIALNFVDKHPDVDANYIVKIGAASGWLAKEQQVEFLKANDMLAEDATDEVAEATRRRWLIDEGIDPDASGPVQVSGRTDYLMGSDEITRIGIEIAANLQTTKDVYAGNGRFISESEATVIEEFMGGFYKALNEQDRKDFQEYYDQYKKLVGAENAMSPQEFFEAEAKSHFLELGMDQPGKARAVLNKGRRALHRFWGMITGASRFADKGDLVPQSVKDLYRRSGIWEGTTTAEEGRRVASRFYVPSGDQVLFASYRLREQTREPVSPEYMLQEAALRDYPGPIQFMAPPGKTAADPITGPADVAAIAADIADESREHVVLVGTDKDGKPHVYHVSSGVLNASLMRPVEAKQWIDRNGIKSVTMVHNHPSGITEASRADLNLVRQLTESMGVGNVGGVILGEDGYRTFDKSSATLSSPQPIPRGRAPMAAQTPGKQVIADRAKWDALPNTSSPAAAAAWFTQATNGGMAMPSVMLLNSSNKPVGLMSLPGLLSDAVADVADDVLSLASRANARSVIITVPMSAAPSTNDLKALVADIGRQLKQANLDLLDVIAIGASGGFGSMVDTGNMPSFRLRARKNPVLKKVAEGESTDIDGTQQKLAKEKDVVRRLAEMLAYQLGPKNPLGPAGARDKEMAEAVINRAVDKIVEVIGPQLSKPGSIRDSMTWYREDVVAAMEIVATEIPEIKDNLIDLAWFKLILAINSLNTQVEPNFDNAVNVYRWLKSEGRLPLYTFEQWLEINKTKKYAWKQTSRQHVIPATGEPFPILVDAKGRPLIKGLPKEMEGAAGGPRARELANTINQLSMLQQHLGTKEALLWLLTPHSGREIHDVYSAAGTSASKFVKKTKVYYGAIGLGPKLGQFWLNLMGIHEEAVFDVWWTRQWNIWMGTPAQFYHGEWKIAKDNLVVLSDGPRDAEWGQMSEAVKRAQAQIKKEYGVDLGPDQIQAMIWYYTKELFESVGMKPQPGVSFKTAAINRAKRRGYWDERLQQNAAHADYIELTAAQITGAIRRSSEEHSTVARSTVEFGYRNEVPPQWSGAPARASFRLRESGEPRSHQRRPGLTAGRPRTVAGDLQGVVYTYEPDQRLSEVLAGGAPPQRCYQTTDAQSYYEALKAAAAANKFGASVTVSTPEELRGSRMFLTEDGGSGVVIKPDGEIGTGFNNPTIGEPGKNKGRLAQLMALGVEEGASTCECFETVLPHIYRQFGFTAKAAVPFSEKYAPADWDYDLYRKFNNGRPRVLLLALEQFPREEIIDRIGSFGEHGQETIPEFEDYEDARRYRDSHVSFRLRKAPLFVSRIELAFDHKKIQAMGGKVKAGKLVNMLKTLGISDNELKWAYIDELVADHNADDKLSVDDIRDWLSNFDPAIHRLVLSDETMLSRDLNPSWRTPIVADDLPDSWEPGFLSSNHKYTKIIDAGIQLLISRTDDGTWHMEDLEAHQGDPDGPLADIMRIFEKAWKGPGGTQRGQLLTIDGPDGAPAYEFYVDATQEQFRAIADRVGEMMPTPDLGGYMSTSLDPASWYSFKGSDGKDYAVKFLPMSIQTIVDYAVGGYVRPADKSGEWALIGSRQAVEDLAYRRNDVITSGIHRRQLYTPYDSDIRSLTQIGDHPTVYDRMMLPNGKEEYVELLFTVGSDNPDVMKWLNYSTGHFSSVTTKPGQRKLFWVRGNVRLDIMGEPFFLIEEIQSDWAQDYALVEGGTDAVLTQVEDDLRGVIMQTDKVMEQIDDMFAYLQTTNPDFDEWVRSDDMDAKRFRAYTDEVTIAQAERGPKSVMDDIHAGSPRVVESKMLFVRQYRTAVSELLHIGVRNAAARGWEAPETLNDIFDQLHASENVVDLGEKALERIAKPVPNMPWMEDWQKMAVRGAIQWAAEQGYTRVAVAGPEVPAFFWSTDIFTWNPDPSTTGVAYVEVAQLPNGTMQDPVNADLIAEYNGSLVDYIHDSRIPTGKHTDRQRFADGVTGRPVSTVYDLENLMLASGLIPQNKIPYLARRLFKKIMADTEAGRSGFDTPRRNGMRHAYGKVLPNLLAKQLKEYGVKDPQHTWYKVRMDEPPTPTQIWTIPPALREAALGSFPSHRVIQKQAEATDAMSLELPDETLQQRSARKLVDSLNRLEQVQRLVGDVPEEQDAYQAATLYIGRASDRIDKFRAEMIDGDRSFAKRLLDAPNSNSPDGNGITPAEFGLFLMAQHAAERNASIHAKHEAQGTVFEGDPSGMSDEVAELILAQYSSTDEIWWLADEFREKVTRARLDVLHDAGLITDEAYDSYTSDEGWQHYVPLKGIAGKQTITHTGKGFSVQGKDIIQAWGRHSQADNPFVQAMADYEAAVVRAEKNRVMTAFAELVKANPSDVWAEHGLKHMPIYDSDGEIQYFKPEWLTDNQLAYWVDGKMRVVEVNDIPLLRGMKNLGAGRAVPLISNFNNYLRAVVTTFNPEFIITNFERDLQTAMANLARSPEANAATAAAILKSLPAALAGVRRNLRKGDDKGWAMWYNDFKAHGARMGWFDMKSIEERTDELEKVLKRAQNNHMAITALRATGKFINDYNEMVESGVRLATYRTLVERGVSRDRAASIAKNLTVNFNRKGEWGSVINSLYLFSNASIQGSAIIMKGLATSKRVRRIAGAFTVLGYLTSMLMRWWDPDEYERMSPWVKDNNWLFPAGSKKTISMRVPYGYNVFMVAGRLAEAMVAGEITAAEATSRMVQAVDNAFNPMGGGSIGQVLAPTFLDPFVQIMENKNFYGGPLSPEQPDYEPRVPRSQLHYKSVRNTTKETVQWLNRIFGGNERVQGMVDLNPEYVDNVVDFLTGGTGKFVANTAETIYSLIDGELPDIRNIPVVRQFVKESDAWTDLSWIREQVAESGRQRYSARKMDEIERRITRATDYGDIDQERADVYRETIAKHQRRAKAPQADIDKEKRAKDLLQVSRARTLTMEENAEFLTLLRELRADSLITPEQFDSWKGAKKSNQKKLRIKAMEAEK